MLEDFVASELMRQRTWPDEEFHPYHYRDRDGMEVDLVLELTGGRVIGIEVKATSSVLGRHFTPLGKLRDRVGDRFLAGFVLHSGRRRMRFADRLYGLPVAALWTL